MQVRRWIAYSTLLALFSEGFMVNAGSVHLLYFYFLLFLNLLLLAGEGSLLMPSGLSLLFGYLVLSGLIGISRGTDSWAGFLKAFAGITPTALYFFAFFRYLKFDVEWCFAMYARFAFYAAILGFAYLPFQATAQGRLMSVFAEPGNFALVCVPAVFYYADQWQQSREYGLRAIVLLVAVGFSASSSGFLGLLLCLYLCGRRYRFGKLLAPAVALLVAVVLYNSAVFFRTRMDDTVQSIDAEDVTGVNQSTFGLVSNFIITEQVFFEHPLIGGGLGSHVVAYDRYIHQVEGADLFSAVGAGELGRWDASSFALRIVSELGVLGLSGAFWFLWYFWPREATPAQRRIALTVIVYVFVKAVRFGNYFNPEVFFFFGAYAVNGLRANSSYRSTMRASQGLDKLSLQPLAFPRSDG